MEHSVRAIVGWASRIATLEVGDVFACGTNHQGLGPMQDGEIDTNRNRWHRADGGQGPRSAKAPLAVQH
jgi:2-keto-4-pentenoate hydratase/2-oxohepta-3-ene-1,7-dioic acid hydratase in catechol pathway